MVVPIVNLTARETARKQKHTKEHLEKDRALRWEPALPLQRSKMARNGPKCRKSLENVSGAGGRGIAKNVSRSRNF